MIKILKQTITIFILFSIAFSCYSQNDVTRFLDIPVDGFKSDMIQKLKSKGYTFIPNSDGTLEGEFNGTNVQLRINTNNNKVWRIIVAETYGSDQANIKIRFNNLIKQFSNNQRYLKQADTTVAKYTIPDDVDISYEILIKKKRYEAIFYQKTLKYDSIAKEKNLLLAKREHSDFDKLDFDRLIELSSKIQMETMKCFNKTVWFMIKEIEYDKYRIVIYYENEYNNANGEGL
jgi:hypothetical protein